MMLEDFRQTERWIREMQTANRIPIASLVNAGDCRNVQIRVLGLTSRSRLLMLAFIFLPKIIIGLGLLMLGVRWLASTTHFVSLILNCMSLGFIVKIDEIMFNVLIPETMKATVSAAKILKTGEPMTA